MSCISSIVEYYGRQKVHSCGYCKTTRGHSDHGMWLHYLTTNDYQNLIDRGWRRSGSYGYKPVLWDACCAMYTIKCAARDLKLSRSQKKLIKRVNRFIVNGERRKFHNRDTASVRETVEITCERQPETSIKRIKESVFTNIEPATLSPRPVNSVPVTSVVETKTTDCANVSRNLSKKRAVRIERAKQRVMAKGKTEQEAIEILKAKKKIPKVKMIEELLRECDKLNTAHKLEVKVVQSSPQNDLFEETFDLEYNLYQKYQVVIHKDDLNKCTAHQFRRFLVNSPLEPHPLNVADAPVASYGSYHQQYWLDGKLIAVGVIDILPHCLSSVYFFYDPDYGDLVLGTYGSMKELELVRELNKYVPELQYYYMGFYIHTCPKMRYKARVSPSYLLCPETYTWQPISRCLDEIEANGVCRLNPDPEAIDEYENANPDNVLVLLIEPREFLTRYGSYRKLRRRDDLNEVKEFIKCVGRKCAYSLILCRG